MTNPDGNAGETPPSDPGSQPSEPSSSGYEAPSIEHSQDRPQSGWTQPSHEFEPQSYGVNPPYPHAIDYPSDIPHGYPPPPPFPGAAGYPPPYPPPGYGHPGYPGGYGMSPPNTTNGLAIGSLVASVLSLFLCGIGLLPALVGIGLGIPALNQIKQSGQSGQGLAIAGIIVGVLSLLFNGGWLLLILAGALTG